MGSRRDCTWILGLAGFRVVTIESEGEASGSRLTIRIERRGVRRYACSGCGRRTGRVRSTRDRTWDDLPWAAHPVTLVYAQRRRPVSPLRHSHRADRVRRSEGAGHAALAAADRRGLSVDADAAMRRCGTA